MDVYRVRAFKFRPSSTSSESIVSASTGGNERPSSSWNCDGEIVMEADLDVRSATLHNCLEALLWHELKPIMALLIAMMQCMHVCVLFSERTNKS